MTISDKQLKRANQVAYTLNQELPAPYQSDLFHEEERLARDILTPRKLAERHILLVGGAGYIGTVLTGQLLAQGYRVRTFDLLLYGNQSCVHPYLGHPSYQFLRGDLVDKDAMEEALKGITDVVILAGLVGDPITRKYPDAAKRINQDGIVALLRSLNGRGLNKVIFISTCSNYGLIEGNLPAAESQTLKPLSLYAEAKVGAEKELLAMSGRVDFAATVLRFATAFGLSPRMRFDLTVSEFTRELFLDKELLVYDADTWRPYCHVRDFSLIIRRVLEAPLANVAFEVFNAGGDVNNFTKQMIVDQVRELLPASRVKFQEHGSDPRNYRVDFAKIRERLYFEPGHRVENGVAELLEALRQQLFPDIDARPAFYGNYELNY